MLAINSSVRLELEASLIGSLGLNPILRTQGESSRLAFLLPVASVLHTIARPSFGRVEEKRQASINKVTMPRSVLIATTQRYAK